MSLWEHCFCLVPTEAFFSFNPDGVVARFSQCLAEFRTWLRTNWLRFNADKTDVMLVGRGTIGDEGRAKADSLM